MESGHQLHQSSDSGGALATFQDRVRASLKTAMRWDSRCQASHRLGLLRRADRTIPYGDRHVWNELSDQDFPLPRWKKGENNGHYGW